MYTSLSRVFKLRGTCSNFWIASNGLLQGCPILMLALNALVSVVLEINDKACPAVTARTYADDISAVCVAQSQEALITKIAKFHRIVKSLEELQFGELSTKKCYTFRNKCLKGKLDMSTSTPSKLLGVVLSQMMTQKVWLPPRKADTSSGPKQ